jgi:hypothetical protein
MAGVTMVDSLGFVAGMMTLVTFAQRRMLPMRLAALSANAAFIAYGALGGIYPVLTLHLLLLPINTTRCVTELTRLRARSAPEQKPISAHPMCRVHASKFAPTCALCA